MIRENTVYRYGISKYQVFSNNRYFGSTLSLISILSSNKDSIHKVYIYIKKKLELTTLIAHRIFNANLHQQ